jgi:hypothetical protein
LTADTGRIACNNIDAKEMEELIFYSDSEGQFTSERMIWNQHGICKERMILLFQQRKHCMIEVVKVGTLYISLLLPNVALIMLLNII